MSTEFFLSRFTPSMMSADVLEKVLVQRGDLADRLVEVIRESIVTPAKHHTLVIGARGIGKTHLLSLVQNRIASQSDLSEGVRIAWLREEEWGVASFLDFLYRILRALATRYEDDVLRNETESLFSLPLRTAERRAADLLRSFIQGRALLLITENLDSVFQGLGKKGQQRLRSYLQEESSWTILASSQALFGGVALYDSPFYGFFDIHHLQELSVDDAARLVQNIAELANNPELAAYVQGESGRARIRAVHHRAGGKHRVYMILSEFLTRDSLDQLVEPFLRMMDDLTPYYQARMEQLSPQQRKIIDLLCGVRGAVTVKEIAKRCFITSQTASGQLKELRARGFVESTPVGRDTYYELSEPLMRLALEVKNQRNGHVRLFLDFLRHWYARPELVDLLANTPSESKVEREYLEWVLAEDCTPGETSQMHGLLKEIGNSLRVEDWAKALPLARRIVKERGGADDWILLAICSGQTEDIDGALAASDKALALDQTNPRAWLVRSGCLLGLNQPEEAVASAAKGVELDAFFPELHAIQGTALETCHRPAEALEAYDRALALADDFILAWGRRARVLLGMGLYPEALESINRALVLDPEASRWVELRGRILSRLNRFSEALQDFEYVINRGESLTPVALAARVVSLIGVGEDALALEAAQVLHQRAPAGGLSNALMARQLVQFERFAAAVPHLAAAKQAEFTEELLLDIGVRVSMALDHLQQARCDLARYLGLLGAGENPVTKPLLRDICSTLDARRRRDKAQVVYEVYRDHGALGDLAAGLVDSADVLVRARTPVEAARAWVAFWAALTGDDERFWVALRLLDTLVKHRETGDSRVFLRLASEERRIVNEVLDRVHQQELESTAPAPKPDRPAKRALQRK